jgi:hypothetical protein
MRTRTLVTLLAAATILCFMTPIAPAQTATTGQIVGVVADPSGAVVAGANVTLTNDAGVRREAQTGSNGRYTFPLLEPGVYQVEVTHAGFASVRLEGIAVKITESSVIDVALKVAGAPTTVSVTGESPLVQTESSAKGTVIDQQEIRALPLPTPQLPAVVDANDRDLRFFNEFLRSGARRRGRVRQRAASALEQRDHQWR